MLFLKKINKKNLIYAPIVISSLMFSGYYFYEWYQFCTDTPLFPEHASQLGYNFYKYNSLTHLYEQAVYKDHGVVATGVSIDRVPDIRDTIGYALLLGVLWKVTGSTKFYWVSLLQIFFFIIVLCLLFQMLWWLYEDRIKALYGVFGILAFLPGVYISVQPVKDIWSFFGTAVLLWVIIGLIKEKLSIKHLLGSALFFALCQWLRPTVFGVLVALLFLGLPFFYWYNKKQFAVFRRVIIWFFCINVLIFWIPWMTYNKLTYDRFVVGPTGLALLVSFGERPNSWGIQVSESWFEEHVKERFPQIECKNGTQEFDDKGKEIFIEYFKKDPALYFINFFYRLKKMVMLNMPCMASFWSYAEYSSKLEAFKKYIQMGPCETIKFCVYVFYVRFFLLIAYLGLILALSEGSALLVVLIAIAVLGNCGEILSHIEDKYFMQCYGFLGIFVGLCVFLLKEFLTKKLKNVCIVKKLSC